MDNLMQRKAAVLAKIAATKADKTNAEAERDSVRGQLAAKAEELAAKVRELADMRTLRDRLQALADLTLWAELASGTAVSVGDRVRYLGRTYECVQAHAKALTRSPINGTYWEEVAE